MIGAIRLHFLFLLLICLPLSGVVAQEEDLIFVLRAFQKHSSVTSLKAQANEHSDIYFRFRLAEEEPADIVVVTVLANDDSHQRIEQGALIQSTGEHYTELIMREYNRTNDGDYALANTDTSTIQLDYASVNGSGCITNEITEGPLDSALLMDAHMAIQSDRSQTESVTQSFINDPTGWVFQLEELPADEFFDPALRVFSIDLQATDYFSDTLPIDELLPLETDFMIDTDDLLTQMLDNLNLDISIWIHGESGLIHRIVEVIRTIFLIDALANPELGIWLEIELFRKLDTVFSEHDQLTEADLVPVCLPS